MEVVAHYLQAEAIGRSEKSEKDLFGRSSYNRYYYATFLIARELATELNPADWSQLAHASYPGILRGTVAKKFAKAREKANKTGDKELVFQCYQAKKAAEDLSRLMEQGNLTRVTADYYPEIPVEFEENGKFKLNSIDVTAARSWPARAKTLSNIILSAWKQIHD